MSRPSMADDLVAWGRVIELETHGRQTGLPRRVAVGYRLQDEGLREEAPSGQLLTGDQNLVNVQVVVNYAVDEDAVVCPEAEVDHAADGER